MTYADIKKKFLIEYDKANVTSSYPSLTDYEIATILDKSYLALIAGKVTGNNPRRQVFEGDVKAISDLQKLIRTAEIYANVPISPNGQFKYPVIDEGDGRTDIGGKTLPDYDFGDLTPGDYGSDTGNNGSGTNNVILTSNVRSTSSSDPSIPVHKIHPCYEYYGQAEFRNCLYGKLPDEFLYYVSAIASYKNDDVSPITSNENIDLVSHETAKNFYTSETNMPWIKHPKMVIEDDIFKVLVDPVKHSNVISKFVGSSNDVNKLDEIKQDLSKFKVVLRYIKTPIKFADNKTDLSKIDAEINDSMCEELINLAIIMAAETVESPRLGTKVQTRPIES